MAASNEFESLVATLKDFHVATAPYNELEIEKKVFRFLGVYDYQTRHQVTKGTLGRYDLLVGGIVIELKKYATKECAEQLDRYAADPNCKGLILMCWKASKPVRRLFEKAKETATIPISLVEMRKNVW